MKQIVGFHAVMSRIKQHGGSVQELYVDSQREDPRMEALIALAKLHKVRVMSVAGERLDGMAQGAKHQGVIARVEAAPMIRDMDELLETIEGTPLLLVLDGVTDPHNVGACLRVADAAGAHAIIAPKDRAAPMNATVAKVASGAAETVPYITVTNLARTLRELQEHGVTIVGTDDAAEQTIYDLDLTGPIAIVMGAEGDGMRRLTREHCDHLVKIPMQGTVGSLNVSVASGVCVFEALRQRRVARPKP